MNKKTEKNKRTTRYLLILLALLLGVYGLVKMFDQKETNIPNTLIMVNSLDIYRIEISISGKQTNVIERQKDQSPWLLYDKENKEKTYIARQKDVDFVLKSIDELKPEEFTSMDTTNRNRYWSSDTTGSRTKLYNKKGKLMADFFVGRTQFRQGFAGRNENSSDVVTYVRRADDNKIFAVAGFLNSFNKDLDGWKEKIFWKFKPEEVEYISFINPDVNQTFEVMKKDNIWFLGEKAVDINLMNDVLFHLSYKEGFETSDEIWEGDFEYQIKIKDILGKEYVLGVHKISNEKFILKSNINSNYMEYKDKSMVDEIFKTKESFLKKTENKS